MEKLMGDVKNIQKEFIKSNPGSYVSPYLLRDLTREMKPEELESIVNAMDPKVAGSPAMAEIKTGLTASLSVSVGKKAPDFTLNDVNGNPVALS
jgi:hypothetical protein